MKCPILMAYALTSKNYFGNLFQWRNAPITPKSGSGMRCSPGMVSSNPYWLFPHFTVGHRASIQLWFDVPFRI